MNLQEAYRILEIPEGSSQDAIKKKYRELTKKYHPDVNKDVGAEDRFKKINEAYQVASSGESTDHSNFRQPYNPFHRQNIRIVEEIKLSHTISFKESVFGTKIDIKYNRKIKCESCRGNGATVENNGCDKCHGRGVIVSQTGNTVFTKTCDKCKGVTQKRKCPICNGEGVSESETSVNVTVPGGIEDGNILRLGGMGNFAGSFMMMEQYTDVFLQIHVIPEPGLSISNMDVVSDLKVSLLEALTGCTKTIKTVDGNRDIVIPPSSRNKDEAKIPNLGVNKIGSHKVILDIEYPTDTSKLIELLSKEE